jgi:hypothetical protein
LAGLLLLTFHHYSRALATGTQSVLSFKDTTQLLQPESALLRLPEEYYYSHLIVG